MSRNKLSANGRAATHPPLTLDLRNQVLDALEGLSLQPSTFDIARSGPKLHSRGGTNAQFLSEVLAALDDLHSESMPAVGAGFGSRVLVRDVDRDTEHTYTLMTGPMLDIEAGDVSLASPIGREGAAWGATASAQAMGWGIGPILGSGLVAIGGIPLLFVACAIVLTVLAWQVMIR